MVIFFVLIFSLVFTSTSSSPANRLPPGVSLIFALQFVTIILMFVLLFIYIKDVFTNQRIPQDKKALWVVVLFVGNMIAMPVYFYLYIWKEPKQEQLTQ
jgi:ABC-type Na+ efflux pump permease subunit